MILITGAWESLPGARNRLYLDLGYIGIHSGKILLNCGLYCSPQLCLLLYLNKKKRKKEGRKGCRKGKREEKRRK